MRRTRPMLCGALALLMGLMGGFQAASAEEPARAPITAEPDRSMADEAARFLEGQLEALRGHLGQLRTEYVQAVLKNLKSSSEAEALKRRLREVTYRIDEQKQYLKELSEKIPDDHPRLKDARETLQALSEEQEQLRTAIPRQLAQQIESAQEKLRTLKEALRDRRGPGSESGDARGHEARRSEGLSAVEERIERLATGLRELRARTEEAEQAREAIARRLAAIERKLSPARRPREGRREQERGRPRDLGRRGERDRSRVPEADERRQRMRHLAEAAQHLEAAGARDLAHHVRARIAQVEQEFRPPRRPEEAGDGPKRRRVRPERRNHDESRHREDRGRRPRNHDREGGRNSGLRQAFQELGEELRQLRTEVSELRETIEEHHED